MDPLALALACWCDGAQGGRRRNRGSKCHGLQFDFSLGFLQGVGSVAQFIALNKWFVNSLVIQLVLQLDAALQLNSSAPLHMISRGRCCAQLKCNNRNTQLAGAAGCCCCVSIVLGAVAAEIQACLARQGSDVALEPQLGTEDMTKQQPCICVIKCNAAWLRVDLPKESWEQVTHRPLTFQA